MNVKQVTHTVSKTLKQPKYMLLTAIVVLVIAAGSGIAIGRLATIDDTSASARQTASPSGSAQRNGRAQAPRANSEASHIAPLPASQASNSSETTKQLVYLIEEEKLAHDVYQKMSELWGARVFGNIQRSETNHQDQLLAVMQSRDIADPRSAEVGVFSDQKLQTLYNQLIAQGSQSVGEAYKVGVAIEELDIADLKADLATLDSKDSDVKATMENLLRGSENHLRAFSRQTQR